MIEEFFSDKLHQVYLLLAGTLGIAVLAACVVRMAEKRKKRKRLTEAAEYVLLQIVQSANTDARQRDPVEEIRLFEELLSSVVPEKKPITFEIAVPNDETDIRFFVAVPAEHTETVRTQVRRVFERAEVREVPDYTVFRGDGETVLTDVSLKKFYGLPIKTYRGSNTDTFASIVGAFAGAKEEHTGMALQMVMRRAPKSAAEKIKQVLGQLKAGRKLKYLQPTGGFDSLIGTAQSLFGGGGSGEPDGDAQAVEEKMKEMLYEMNIRVAVCTATKERTDLLFDTLKQRFTQFEPSGYNGFTFRERSGRKAALNLSFRLLDPDTAVILTAEEVSSVFHLYNQDIEVSNLQWEHTKRTAAPTELGTEGLLLGDNIFHGKKTPVHIPDKDRLRHIYIIGQTGTGKTALIKSMAHQDIQNGKGACIIDPHGDLVDDMLATVPEHRLDDVILFDPSDTGSPLAINMLEYDRTRPEEKTFIIDEILSIFRSLFSAETMGPMFDQYLRNSLLLLMEGKTGDPAILTDVSRVLTDDSFRENLLRNCSIDPVRRFWEDEASKVEGEASLANIAPYITSKFANFISNDYIRPIITRPYSSFSFREIMDGGKLLFVKLPQGKIGEINAGLIGMIVTGKIALAAFGRDDVPEDERRDFYLYIDEFQNFTTGSISKILSEARKYRLSLNIAHQLMAQITDDIRGAVLGNVGTIISFRVGIEDAEVLEKKFVPSFSAQELIKTENLNCVIAMLSNGVPLSPFTMHIRFAPRGDDAVREAVARYAAVKYGAGSGRTAGGAERNAGDDGAEYREKRGAERREATDDGAHPAGGNADSRRAGGNHGTHPAGGDANSRYAHDGRTPDGNAASRHTHDPHRPVNADTRRTDGPRPTRGNHGAHPADGNHGVHPTGDDTEHP